MKKLLALFLALLMILSSLIACENEETPKNNESESESETVTESNT